MLWGNNIQMGGGVTTLVERLRRIRISAVSPKKLVAATVEDGEHVTIRCGSTVPGPGDETVVAREVVAVIARLKSGYDEAFKKIMADHVVQQPPSRGRRERLTKRQEALAEAYDTIALVTTSPRRFVKARIQGTGALEVKLRPGAIGRLDLSNGQLFDEINATISDVLQRYHSETMRIQRTVRT